MTLTYLIDTDWVIDHFNRVERTTEKLKELRPAGIAVSVVSLAELYEGIAGGLEWHPSEQGPWRQGGWNW